MVRINVDVLVLVGRGVWVEVNEGRKVQVGRGVRVMVLVLEGVRVGCEVTVTKAGELVGVRLAGDWEKYLRDMNKNNTTASPNNNKTGMRRGEGLVEPFAIVLAYSKAARYSESTISTRDGSKSCRGGFTFQ
jgi:hypothetical protein